MPQQQPQQVDLDALAKRFGGSVAADVQFDAEAPQAPERSNAMTALNMLLDLGKGFAKGAAHTAIDLGSLVQKLPSLTPGAPPLGEMTNLAGNAIGGLAGQAMHGTQAPPVTNDAANAAAREQTAYSNTTQRVGGGLETLAELAAPVAKGAQAIPSTERAGKAFQSVMSAAKNVPVDVNGPGAVALRISQLAERGGSMPMAVRKFLARVTDPERAAMTYEEARDFASNISRLSANEYGRLTPVVAREVASLRVALNDAVAKAAQKAGKGAEYKAAMREYAQAMRIKDAVESVVEGAKKGLPYATAAGAGTWLTMKLRHLLAAE